jgi:hypothetical protein
MDHVTNYLINIDESAIIEDSEDKNHWKDLVEAVEHLQGM